MSEISKVGIDSKAPASISGSMKALIKKEWLMGVRHLQELVNPLIFFAIVIVLFPLGVNPSPEFLSQAAVGLVWVTALLSTMLSLDRLFQADFDDGSLEQLVLSGQPLYLLVLVKYAMHWVLTAIPLIMMSPLLAVMLHLDPAHLGVLVITLLLGTPVITLIGGIGAALTVSLRSGGVLVSLLVLPLTIPVLIFGSGTVQAAVDGVPIAGHLAIMGGMLMLAITLAPFASSGALRMSVSS